MAVLFGATGMMQIELFFLMFHSSLFPRSDAWKGTPQTKFDLCYFLIYICVFVYLAYEAFLFSIFMIPLAMQYLFAIKTHNRQIFIYYMNSHSV